MMKVIRIRLKEVKDDDKDKVKEVKDDDTDKDSVVKVMIRMMMKMRTMINNDEDED